MLSLLRPSFQGGLRVGYRLSSGTVHVSRRQLTTAVRLKPSRATGISLFAGGIGLATATSYLYMTSHCIRNDGAASAEALAAATEAPQNLQDLQEKPVCGHELVPDPDADTFEMGLYRASQKELDDEEKQRRDTNTHLRVVGPLYRVAYFLKDYVLEPTLTCVRFLQLATLFLPVALAYPMVYFGKRTKEGGERAGALKWYQFVRLAAEAAGASFIKLGQWAASRTDIFSQGMCDELSKLHSDAKAHGFNATKQILNSEFDGLTMDDLFDEFYPEPVGCGAIAQVYLAKLSPAFAEKLAAPNDATGAGAAAPAGAGDGNHDALVAVKIEHPGVRSSIERDLKIMMFFANMINALPTMEWLSFPQEVEQFAIMMKLQLDMRIEAQNLDRFSENFKTHDEIKFPLPRYSSRQVLIEERINGLGMNKVLELNRHYGKQMSKQISDNLVDSFLKMLILDNFVHADLHPGNIFVRFVRKTDNGKKVLASETEVDQLMNELTALEAEGKDEELAARIEQLYTDKCRPQICYIDAGLVTELNDTNRYNFISLFNALSQFDGYKAGSLMIERSRTPETVEDPELFKYKVAKLVDTVRQRTFTLGSISIGDILEQMLSMVRVHHVRMEGDFVTVVVAILLLEGIGRQLDPDLDLFARSIPCLRQIGLKEGKLIFKDQDKLSMVKVWLTLEARQFINASVHDVYTLVKADGLAPNY